MTKSHIVEDRCSLRHKGNGLGNETNLELDFGFECHSQAMRC